MAQLGTLLGLAWLAAWAPGCQGGPWTGIKVKKIPSVECHRGNTGSIFEFSATDIWKTTNIQLSDYQNKQEPGANATEILNGIKYVRPGNFFEPNFPMFSKIEVNGNNQHPLYAFLKLVVTNQNTTGNQGNKAKVWVVTKETSGISFCPPTRDGYASKKNLFWEPIMNSDVRWNFEKYLIDYNGRPVRRYDPSTPPEAIIKDIQVLINNYITPFTH